MVKPHLPTIRDLQTARQAFEENEPRDLFYRAATELVDRAWRGESSLNVAEALGVLLQTWNRAFYTYRPFDSAHFLEIEGLVAAYRSLLERYRERSIESFGEEDEEVVEDVFRAFEEVLGPVGAAKCLHLLAPRFFPLWDRAIAAAYEVALRRRGKNADRYCKFLRMTKEQVEALGGERVIGRNPLKALDEYNYCRYTKGWI